MATIEEEMRKSFATLRADQRRHSLELATVRAQGALDLCEAVCSADAIPAEARLIVLREALERSRDRAAQELALELEAQKTEGLS